METIKTKKRFMELVIYMDKPILVIGEHEVDMINKWFLIKDSKDRSKTFNLPGCRLKSGKITQLDLDNYYQRENSLLDKYCKWMEDLFGDAFEIREV